MNICEFGKKAIFSALLVMCSVAVANWIFVYRPINGQMALYAGGLGDPTAPNAEDAKVSFHLQGKSARDLFDRMGPDVKSECINDPKTRVRTKDRLECIRYSATDYSCYFGFDLKTGKSIGGSIC
ncbi:hypothetical protein [Acidovorax sp.]|uniref:hypothetical protein n=1 Tax=Acidovorax sp. TaxID=1872122 RepID=UPI00391CA641